MIRRALALSLCCLAFTAAAADAGQHDMMSDKRIVIPVSSSERNQVLYEMRAFLQGLYNVHNALADKDMKRLAVSARTLAPLLKRVPESMRDRLPVEFLELSHAMRESFNAMAEDAEANKGTEAVQRHLAETMAYCAGCHETFRFQVRSVTGR